MRDVELIPPRPGAHQAGTVRLLRVFADLAGTPARAGLLTDWVERPEAAGEGVDRRHYGLKYDAYLTRSDAGVAWGVAVNDRYEGRASLERATERLIARLPGDYDLAAARAIEQRFGHPGASTTIAVGFDRPDRPPRLKVYLQEESWDAGLATLGELAEHTGARLPDWLPAHTRAGVATVGLLPDGTLRLKAYVGGPDPVALVAGAPAGVQGLGRSMATASPAPDGWYYLTIRFDPDGWRFAVNKIYNAVQLGFTRDGAGIDGAWDDVAGLFEAAGQGPTLAALRRALPPGLRVVPTATAVEDGGRSVDVYCGAWELGPR